MVVENGKIVEATENELLKYWLKEWSELYSFQDYMSRVQQNGVKVIEDKRYYNNSTT